MKVYFAGISSNVNRLDYLQEFGGTRLMLTYADANRYTKQLARAKSRNLEILFDSGAYGLWRRGISLNITDYCDYLINNNLTNYIVLDKIGDHAQTMQNQKSMEDYGMSPIPVFHMGSDFKHLDEICEKYDYVCLGGTVGSDVSKRMQFFTDCFDRHKNHKFHGLGLTDIRIIKAFPFYSVDSTTWLIAQKANRIFDAAGNRITPPQNMSAKDKFENTITYFINMEKI